MNNFWTTLPRPIVALAPMEGVTDSAFRQLCRRHGADVVYTEFISSDAISHRAPSVLKKMDFNEAEQPVVCQIFGRDLDAFRRAAEEVQRRGFAGLDINFGCPARKVVSHGSGVSLMRDPVFARQLVEAVLGVASLPVSIKVRTSIRKESKDVQPGCTERITALDLVEALRGLPIAAVMVHGRSHEQGFSGTPDTEMIRRVREKFSGLVLANGGITSPDDAQALLTATGADGVGIARGCIGNPNIFQSVAHALRGRILPSIPNIQELILEHAQLILATKGERAIVELRKHLAAYVRGMEHATSFRRRLNDISSYETVKRFVQDLPK